MNRLALKIYVALQTLRGEQGQDMIEYILIAGIVALGATAGMQTFATDVNAAFNNLGNALSSYI